MMKKVLLLVTISFLLNGCTIVSKVFVRNYYNEEVTLIVENLWIAERAKKGKIERAVYAPEILNISNGIYKHLNDTLEFSYDVNGTLGIKIPANSTVFLEAMGNSAPSKDTRAVALKRVEGREKEIATYTASDIKYKSFHKYYLDIKP